MTWTMDSSSDEPLNLQAFKQMSVRGPQTLGSTASTTPCFHPSESRGEIKSCLTKALPHIVMLPPSLYALPYHQNVTHLNSPIR